MAIQALAGAVAPSVLGSAGGAVMPGLSTKAGEVAAGAQTAGQVANNLAATELHTSAAMLNSITEVTRSIKV